MSILEFINFSKFEKARALNAYGVFVAERRLGPDRIYLYALNYFYIELLHELSDIHNGGVTVYRVFDTIDYLDAYLENVDITGLTTAD